MKVSIVFTALLLGLAAYPAGAHETSMLLGDDHAGPEASMLQGMNRIGGNTGHVAQAGSGNGVAQIQAGRNHAVALQFGKGNQAVAGQRGLLNATGVLQVGKGNAAMTGQAGALNSIRIGQTGGEFLLVLQKGALNRLTAAQKPDRPAVVIQRGIHEEPKIYYLRPKAR